MSNITDFYNHPNLNGIRVHLSHNDLDGYGCHVISAIASTVKWADGEVPSGTDCNLHYRNIGNPADIIEALDAISNEYDYAEVLITDLNATSRVVDKLDENGNYRNCHIVAWVDHHITEPGITTKLDNMGIETIINSEDSATYHLCVEILPKLQNCSMKDRLFDYAMSVSRYDTGRWGNWDTTDVNSVSRALKENLAFFGIDKKIYVRVRSQNIIAGDDGYPYMAAVFNDAFTREFGMLSSYMQMFKDNLMDVNTNDFGMTIGNLSYSVKLMPIYLPNLSIIAKKYLDDHSEVPALIILDNKHKSISLRSSEKNHPEINCRDIAAMYGGGGHKNAAGFPANLNAGLVYHVSFSNAFMRDNRICDAINYTPNPILDDEKNN